MALRKLFSMKRLFNGGIKTTVPFIDNITTVPPNASKTKFPSSPTDRGYFHRFFLRPAVYHSGTRLSEIFPLPVGEKLREKLVDINNFARTGDRLRQGDVNLFSPDKSEMSVENARKILRASQMEKVKVKLKNIPENSVSYREFLRICVDSSQNDEQGVEFAKILDDSGNVIVLGNVVFLRPEQVAKTIEGLIYQSMAKPNDPRRKELEEMERQKAIIDEKAKARVRTELYCGLGFLTIQTLGLMRLTFWELSWDVMEPICFFITSLHFAFAYLFFIRTSTEPTFQGYFHRRFVAKRERLMKIHKFDILRYNELCKVCYPSAKFEASPTPLNYSEEMVLTSKF